MTSLSDDGSLFGGQSPGKSKRSTAQASKKQLRKRRPERLSEEESHAKPIKKSRILYEFPNFQDHEPRMKIRCSSSWYCSLSTVNGQRSQRRSKAEKASNVEKDGITTLTLKLKKTPGTRENNGFFS